MAALQEAFGEQHGVRVGAAPLEAGAAQGNPHHSSVPTGPRRLFVSDRFFLLLSRASFDARDGFVFRRGFGLCSACAIILPKRSVTSSLFWCWLRLPALVSRSTPSSAMRVASFSAIRARCSSVMRSEERH